MLNWINYLFVACIASICACDHERVSRASSGTMDHDTKSEKYNQDQMQAPSENADADRDAVKTFEQQLKGKWLSSCTFEPNSKKYVKVEYNFSDDQLEYAKASYSESDCPTDSPETFSYKKYKFTSIKPHTERVGAFTVEMEREAFTLNLRDARLVSIYNREKRCNKDGWVLNEEMQIDPAYSCYGHNGLMEETILEFKEDILFFGLFVNGGFLPAIKRD